MNNVINSEDIDELLTRELEDVDWNKLSREQAVQFGTAVAAYRDATIQMTTVRSQLNELYGLFIVSICVGIVIDYAAKHAANSKADFLIVLGIVGVLLFRVLDLNITIMKANRSVNEKKDALTNTIKDFSAKLSKSTRTHIYDQCQTS